MQGLVLGFDPTTGVGIVRGEDNKRYPFLIKQWRSGGTPKPQDAVDFELSEERLAGKEAAAEIYLLKRGGSIDIGALSDGAAKFSETAAKGAARLGSHLKETLGDEAKRKEFANTIASSDAAQFALARPALILGALIILGCFAPITSALGRTASLWSIMGFVGDAIASIDQMGAFMGGGKGAPSLFMMKLAPRCLYLLYAIPIFAGVLVYKEFIGTAKRKDRLRAALAGLLTPFVALILAGIVAYLSIPKELRDMMWSMGGSPASMARGMGAGLRVNVTDYLGWGLYLIWIASALLLAVVFKWIDPVAATAKFRRR